MGGYVEETELPAVESATTSDREKEALGHEGMSYEDAGLNSKERLGSDVLTLHRKGSFLNIATWNVRTLYKKGKLDNVIMELEEYKIDILGMAAVRWTDAGRIQKNGHLMFFSGGKEHRNGVGVIVNRKYASAVQGYWPISERVMMVKIAGNPYDLAIIQVYAPTSEHSDEEI